MRQADFVPRESVELLMAAYLAPCHHPSQTGSGEFFDANGLVRTNRITSRDHKYSENRVATVSISVGYMLTQY